MFLLNIETIPAILLSTNSGSYVRMHAITSTEIGRSMSNVFDNHIIMVAYLKKKMHISGYIYKMMFHLLRSVFVNLTQCGAQCGT